MAQQIEVLRARNVNRATIVVVEIIFVAGGFSELLDYIDFKRSIQSTVVTNYDVTDVGSTVFLFCKHFFPICVTHSKLQDDKFSGIVTYVEKF